MKVATLICHAPFLVERKATLARLLEQVPSATVLASRRREHAAIWSRRSWEWCEDSDADGVAILNDDVTVPPDFQAIVRAMLEATNGERILSLHAIGYEAAKARGPWIRSYHLTGPGFVIPRGMAAKLLDFWARLPWGFASHFNEDNVAASYMWENQSPAYVSIPAIVQHDTSVPSSLGYDDHPHRTSSIPWTDERFAAADLTSPEYWRVTEEPPYSACPWMPTAYLEALRRGFRMNHQCNICWQNESVARHHDLDVCPKCIAALANTALHAMLVQ